MDPVDSRSFASSEEPNAESHFSSNYQSHMGDHRVYLQTEPCSHFNPSNLFQNYYPECSTMSMSPSMIFSSPSITMSRNSNGATVRPFKPIQNRSNSILSRDPSEYIDSLNVTPDKFATMKRMNPLPRSRSDKANKGLRHFSQKVMEKVKSQGKTTYNEVADELVREFGQKSADPEVQSYDQKNIRRRVYDALNVLMAMNIIHKDKKDISWVGFPNNSVQEYQTLETKRDELKDSIRQKLKNMKDLLLQQISVSNLVEENRINNIMDNEYKISLPFAVITTESYSTVDCSVTDQRDEYLFAFQSPFEVYDEAALIRAVGSCFDIGNSKTNKLDYSKCMTILPKTLHRYVEALSSTSYDNFEEFILSNRDLFVNQISDNVQMNGNAPEHLFLSKTSDSYHLPSANGQMLDPTQLL